MPPSIADRRMIQQRQSQVARLYLRGYKSPQIAEALANPRGEVAERFDVDESTVRRDIILLTRQWQKQAVEDVGKRKALELAVLEEMDHEAAVAGIGAKDPNWQAQRLRLRESIRKLLGLDAPMKTEHSGAVTVEEPAPDFASLSEEELETYIALNKKLRGEGGQTLGGITAS